MYRTCLFCRHDLGANATLEAFPVGSRLAYDAGKGRLWVVCPACARWNLTPLEERWEAVEQAERLYRATRTRVATDEIGLARLRDGTELVRVGRPLRPEFAAWRWGDALARRRRVSRLRELPLAVARGGAHLAPYLLSLLAGPVGFLAGAWGAGAARDAAAHRPLARVLDGEGTVRTVRHGAIAAATPVVAADGGFALRLPVDVGVVTLDGAEARRVAALVLARVNRLDGLRDDVQRAVGSIDAAGGPEPLLGRVARQVAHAERSWARLRAFGHADAVGLGVEDAPAPTGFAALTPAQRLAVEMALHEEAERIALAGELRALEAAWREAEAIAAIADDLLVPSGVRARLAALRTRAARSASELR